MLFAKPEPTDEAVDKDEEIGQPTDTDNTASLSEAISEVLAGSGDDAGEGDGRVDGEGVLAEDGTPGDDDAGDESGAEDAGEGEEAKKDEPEGDDKDSADPDDYAMPEGLSERAASRFEKLVTASKEKDEVITQQTEVLNGFKEMINDTGMNNDEFVGMLNVAKMLKTDPQAGIDALHNVIAQTAKEAGIDIQRQEYDLLDDFPDLKEKVEDLEITRDVALELAANRRKAKAQEAANTVSPEEESYNTSRTEALQNVGNMLKEYEKDVDWDVKGKHIHKAAIYAAKNLHPSQWLSHIQDTYENISDVMKESGKGRRTDNPLTGGEGKGGGKTPQTVGDVINSIL